MLTHVETSVQQPFSQKIKKLQGKTVVIVGDASAIGHATAALLASEGARVHLAASSDSELRKAAAAGANEGGGIDGQVVEPGISAEVRRFFEKAQAWLGHIDAVVSFITLENKPEDDQDMIQLLWTQEAIPYLKMDGCGQIIHLDSARNKIQAADALSDRSMVAALRRQARELGIRVTLIEPDFEIGDPRAEDAAAHAVLATLEQPFGVDAGLPQGPIQ
jgi:NADP-dependent 3-hydroxy acid dehydrogenase YdfG